MRFDEWLDQEYPDGMGSGFGGAYTQDDMEAAWEAGKAAALLKREGLIP